MDSRFWFTAFSVTYTLLSVTILPSQEHAWHQHTVNSSAFSEEKDPLSLDLTNVDKVNVLLFDLEKPREVRLSVYSGSTVLVAGERRVILDSLSVPIRLRSSPAGVRVTIGGLDIGTEMVRIDPIGRSVLRVEGLGDTYRYYSGNHRITATKAGTLRWIHTTDIETYIGGVVASEMGFNQPEALKSQAVASRTYLLWTMRKNEGLDFDILDHHMNQVFKGVIPYKEIFQQAAMDTRSEILTWQGQLIQSVFSSTCGGVTTSNEDVWPDGEPLPFLRSVDDNKACSISPNFTWQSELSRREVYAFMNQTLKAQIRTLVFTKDERGRVVTVKASTVAPNNPNWSAGVVREFTGTDFRLLINNRFGIGALRSTWIDWQEDGDTIRIEGKGFGHGVGLCQWGANGLADAGWGYSDILSFYFGGSKIVNFSQLESNKITLYE